MAAVDKVMVGEADVVTEGGDNEISHVDLLMGPRGSAVEDAFCNALCNNKDGFRTLLEVVAPNLLCKPNTILFNKLTIKPTVASSPKNNKIFMRRCREFVKTVRRRYENILYV